MPKTTVLTYFAAAFHVEPVSGRTGQFQRAGGQVPDVQRILRQQRTLRGPAERIQERPGHAHHPRLLRDRSPPRLLRRRGAGRAHDPGSAALRDERDAGVELDRLSAGGEPDAPRPQLAPHRALRARPAHSRRLPAPAGRPLHHGRRLQRRHDRRAECAGRHRSPYAYCAGSRTGSATSTS